MNPLGLFKPILLQHGASLLLPLMLGGGATAFWAGGHTRNNAWLARQAVVERAAHQAYADEVARSTRAATGFATEYSAMQDSFTTLEGKFRELQLHAPLLVYRAGPARPAVPGPLARPAPPGAHAGAAEPAPAGTEPAPPAPNVAPGGAVADPGLSLGAVWLWNSALAGTDQPAGACGAADPAAPACALEAGLAVADAWANHADNARTCALDRLSHQRLIDYLNAGHQGPPKP